EICNVILLLHFADCAVYEDDFPVAVLVNLPQATLEGHVQGPSQDRDDFAFGLADGDVPSRPRRRAVLSRGLPGPPRLGRPPPPPRSTPRGCGGARTVRGRRGGEGVLPGAAVPRVR